MEKWELAGAVATPGEGVRGGKGNSGRPDVSCVGAGLACVLLSTPGGTVDVAAGSRPASGGGWSVMHHTWTWSGLLHAARLLKAIARRAMMRVCEAGIAPPGAPGPAAATVGLTKVWKLVASPAGPAAVAVGLAGADGWGGLCVSAAGLSGGGMAVAAAAAAGSGDGGWLAVSGLGAGGGGLAGGGLSGMGVGGGLLAGPGGGSGSDVGPGGLEPASDGGATGLTPASMTMLECFSGIGLKPLGELPEARASWLTKHM